jgi:hypothetical protein
MKATLSAAASAAVLLLALGAGPASATNVYEVYNVTLNPYEYLDVNGASQLAGAIGLDIVGRSTPLWVFCVDLYHDIVLTSYSPPLPYIVSPVLYDSSNPSAASGSTGNLLSSSVTSEIGFLADIGANIANQRSLNQTQLDELTDIQGAIWRIEYPSVSITGTSQQNAAMAAYVADAVSYVSSYVSSHGSYPGDPYGFYSQGGGYQGFGFSQGFTSGIPEPASWAMMITGIAGLGAALRSRRSRLRQTPSAGGA